MRRHFTNVRRLLTLLKRLLTFVKRLFSGEWDTFFGLACNSARAVLMAPWEVCRCLIG